MGPVLSYNTDVREKSSILLIFVTALAMAQAPQGGPLPKFEDFKVAEVFKGVPAQPILVTSGQRMFRTRIREAAKAGPNFAGHYAVAEWGCGAACVGFVIVDEKTGAILNAPASVLSFLPDIDFVDLEKNDLMGAAYKKDSRLLILRGCTGVAGCASVYYEWTGDEFKLLRRLPAVPVKP
jgi:hypothetical protein